MLPKISVILCTYNRKDFLIRMLNSVQAQTFKNFELILINNGATDGTEEVCERYAKEDSRINLITIEVNKGAANARNIGIDNAKGDYILMIDDDDYCQPKMFQQLVDMTQKYNVDISIIGSVQEHADGTTKPKYVFDELYLYENEECISEFLKREKFNTAPATKLFKKTLFDGLRWTVGTRVDDIHFIYKLFVKAKSIAVTGIPLYYVYKHDNNMTSFLSGDILKSDVLDDYLTMQDERVEYVSERLPSLEEQVKYARVSYMISMVERIKEGNAIDCEKQLDYMINYLRENKDDLLNKKWTTDREIKLMNKYVMT